mmetsp:Transcript_12119/g.13641  ORF Transcript_12119/g.13641 Transcript_12119/m.13641 type:complete len:101 (-) Transcript_12119:21-323(-)
MAHDDPAQPHIFHDRGTQISGVRPAGKLRNVLCGNLKGLVHGTGHDRNVKKGWCDDHIHASGRRGLVQLGNQFSNSFDRQIAFPVAAKQRNAAAAGSAHL